MEKKLIIKIHYHILPLLIKILNVNLQHIGSIQWYLGDYFYYHHIPLDVDEIKYLN